MDLRTCSGSIPTASGMRCPTTTIDSRLFSEKEAFKARIWLGSTTMTRPATYLSGCSRRSGGRSEVPSHAQGNAPWRPGQWTRGTLRASPSSCSCTPSRSTRASSMSCSSRSAASARSSSRPNAQAVGAARSRSRRRTSRSRSLRHGWRVRRHPGLGIAESLPGDGPVDRGGSAVRSPFGPGGARRPRSGLSECLLDHNCTPFVAIRRRLSARQTRLHSPATLRSPRRLNARKPSTRFTHPKTGSTIAFRLR